MEWLLLAHSLPPKPLYLRAKIRQRLERVGALALKNAVYVLPRRDDCLEDLQWIAQEAVAGGGSAFLCEAGFLHGISGEELKARFQAESAARYRALRDELRPSTRARTTGDRPAAAARARRRLEEIRAVDFFEARERAEVEAMVQRLEATGERAGESPRRGARARAALVGRVWVTRRGPKVDRLATAWLVRRFIDARARFRFVENDAPRAAGSRELRFDMVGGDFTHEGERCTFETVLAAAGVADAGLRAVGEIVHDIDLKDARFSRVETAGFQRMLEGLYRAHPGDEDRLRHALPLFDALYDSFRRPVERSRPRRKRRP